MDVKPEVRPRFLNHGDLRAWFLIDLEKGTIHEPSKPLFICKYDVVHCGSYLTQRCINALIIADVHGKITLKPLIPPLG